MRKLKEELDKCLMCKNPRCSQFCPIHTAIPEVINLFKEGKLIEAGEILFENNPLSLICAIVCPHEDQCKGHCIKGIKGVSVDFPSIEYHVSKYFLENNTFEKPEEQKGERVGIIGAGPAGITIAFILAQRGYQVTLFDAHEKIGGVLRYGIPEFRLPKSLLDMYEHKLRELGVKIRPNTLIGPVLTLDKLFTDGYKALFIGTGVWNPKTLDIKGETLGHVHYAIDYLKAPHVYELGDKVCVIGAGNVAMDAARTAKRNGAKEVRILYRKDFDSMSATKAEIKEAVEEGIIFDLFKAPVECLEEGVRYIKMQNQTNEEGKEITVPIEGSEDITECDSIIIAISQSPKNNIVSNTKGLETSKYGLLITDDSGHTTREGVFASGDVVTGAKTVVKAVAHAKIVADEMDKYLKSIS